jgi:hypothetical protein
MLSLNVERTVTTSVQYGCQQKKILYPFKNLVPIFQRQKAQEKRLRLLRFGKIKCRYILALYIFQDPTGVTQSTLKGL